MARMPNLMLPPFMFLAKPSNTVALAGAAFDATLVYFIHINLCLDLIGAFRT